MPWRRSFIATAGSAVMASALAGCVTIGARRIDRRDRPTNPPQVEPFAEDPRIDEPPHPIDPPEVDGDADLDERMDSWNAHYLGEAMAETPTLPFETVDRVPPLVLTEPTASFGSSYGVLLLNDGAAVRDALAGREDHPAVDEALREELLGIDFDEHALVNVLAGGGSGSVGIRWARIEPIDDGIHLHGYLTQPYLRTDDFRPHTSTVVVGHEGAHPGVARVSLTRSVDERVHVNSTEGLVEVD